MVTEPTFSATSDASDIHTAAVQRVIVAIQDAAQAQAPGPRAGSQHGPQDATGPARHLARLRAAISSIRTTHDAVARARLEAVQTASRAIRTAAIREFRETESAQFEALLRGLRQSGVPLAALSVCGHGTAEIRYTKLLGYFLDPRMPHGLGSRALRAVVSGEARAAGWQVDAIPWEEAEVFPECSLGTADDSASCGRVDLLVVIGDLIVVIEQKISSAESAKGESRQLKHYSDALRRSRFWNPDSPAVRLYLTPTGRRGSDDEWVAVTHVEFFRRLASVMDSPALGSVARHNLCCLLWDLLMGPMAISLPRLREMEHIVVRAIEDPARSFELKKWFAANLGRDTWTIVIRMMIEAGS